MTPRRRVAIVEPYLGGSHRAWAEGYAAASELDVTVIGLPAMHWKWRMQGGHLALAPAIDDDIAERGPYDVVLASGMTNLPALLGQCRSTLAHTPVVLYMHENQLTYPRSPDDHEDLTYPMINWASMSAADLVVFNSQFHLEAWFDALPAFLRRFPDHQRGDLVAAVRRRSVVLPVGVDLRPLDAIERTTSSRPLIVWNQRWEHDKAPEDFAAAMTELAARGYVFDIALAGRRSDPEHPALGRLRATLGDRIVHDGDADLETYRRLLRRCDIVVSTARQEFFGISLTEAIAAGAFPIVPDRLVYPERIPSEHHAACLYRTGVDLVDRLRWAIERSEIARSITASLQVTMAELDWSVVAPRYDETLLGLAR